MPHAFIRITPADAGKTEDEVKRCRFDKDHPRGCGENLSCLLHSRETMGSPPRMRGKRFPSSQLVTLPRITPADAGKTRRSGRRSAKQGDHPRGCGENLSEGSM